jgi:hypothetical protein
MNAEPPTTEALQRHAITLLMSSNFIVDESVGKVYIGFSAHNRMKLIMSIVLPQSVLFGMMTIG